MKRKIKKLSEALYKKALGYTAEEVSEEYCLVDNKMVLSKRKLNTKTFPPDLSALQLLLAEMDNKEENIYETYSLEDLEKERKRLKELLEASEKQAKHNSTEEII